MWSACKDPEAARSLEHSRKSRRPEWQRAEIAAGLCERRLVRRVGPVSQSQGGKPGYESRPLFRKMFKAGEEHDQNLYIPSFCLDHISDKLNEHL